MHCGALPASRIERTIGDALSAADMMAAYAAEEYEVLLSDVPPEDALKEAAALASKLVLEGSAVRYGMACFPRDGRSAEELIARACAEVLGSAVAGSAGATFGPLAPPPILMKPPAASWAAVANDGMARLERLVDRIAAGNISVLVLGETGVGKEVMAETIHRRSARAGRPFLRLNCAALTETLVENELFGHEKSAFTGAHAPKPGLLESAQGGTIFLDEVGELPPALQVKLLRVLEERQVLRVGGLKARPIDVRFISATNRDLELEMSSGRFRRDLYFRLDGISLVIPPLRERIAEIEPLARRFVAESARQQGRVEPRLSPDVLAYLRRYAWPGNIRELRNMMERAVLLCAGDVIGVEHVPIERIGIVPATTPQAASDLQQTSAGLRREIGTLERRRISDALVACAGNQSHAAKLLGISRGTLVARLEAYGLPRPRRRTPPEVSK
jgi:transcriptional regulator with PAS, ATPase and Fis domain